MSFAILALIPALTLSASPVGRTVGAMVVPLDHAAEPNVLRFETYLAEALAPYTAYSVRRPDELFGLPEDGEARAALKRAEAAFTEGSAAFERKKFDDAERTLRASIKDFGRGVSLLKECGHLCDATAMYAGALQRRGDSDEAKLVLMDLLALGPTYELSAKRYPKELIQLRAAVAASNAAALRGGIRVTTRPAGARVFVDGEAQGFAPVEVGTLRTGKHFIRVERPGFKIGGQIVEVTPEEQEVLVDLVPTPAYRIYLSNLVRLGAELKAPEARTVASVAAGLGLSHVVVGGLKNLKDGGSELTLGFYDAHSGKQLAFKHVNFQGDEYGQLKAEVQRTINLLLTDTGVSTARSSDPLQNRQGTETWSSEDHGGKAQQQTEKRPPKGDPLKGKSGTEDW